MVRLGVHVFSISFFIPTFLCSIVYRIGYSAEAREFTRGAMFDDVLAFALNLTSAVQKLRTAQIYM